MLCIVLNYLWLYIGLKTLISKYSFLEDGFLVLPIFCPMKGPPTQNLIYFFYITLILFGGSWWQPYFYIITSNALFNQHLKIAFQLILWFHFFCMHCTLPANTYDCVYTEGWFGIKKWYLFLTFTSGKIFSSFWAKMAKTCHSRNWIFLWPWCWKIQ